MSKLSNAQDYFSQILAKDDPYTHLVNLAATDPPTVETEWLEFKGCERINEAQIKSYWSQALSGFANTGGGVLVWGLDARKDPETQVDKVTGISLHQDAEALASRLRELVVQSVDPPVGGVEIRTIRQNEAKAGCVICLIPEGKAKAHRAEGADRNYYLRIGTSFIIPPVSVLRSLFHPTSAPFLEPSVCIIPKQGNSLLAFHFCLENTGSLTAKTIHAVVSHDENLHFLPNETDHIYPIAQTHPRLPVRFRESIHPDMEVVGFMGLRCNDYNSIRRGVDFLMKVSCEDTALTLWKCELSMTDLVNRKRVKFTQES